MSATSQCTRKNSRANSTTIYHVSISTGLIRRNRFHLRRIPNEGETVESNNLQPVRDSYSVMTRSGRISNPPSRRSPAENT